MNINTATEFPAVSGAVVTEGHANTCRKQGHATHTVDGVDTGICPRCGDVKLTAADVAAFEAILDIEQEVRIVAAVQAFAPIATRDDQHAAKASNVKSAKARLSAAVDALTPAQMLAFGQYRKRA